MDHGPGTLLAHPALVALAQVDARLDGLAGANLWSLSGRDLLELRVAQARTLARLQATILASTGEIDSRGAAVDEGAPSTAAWLRGRLLMHPGAATAEVALAKDLAGGLGGGLSGGLGGEADTGLGGGPDTDLSSTGAALAAGDISRDQAAAIALAVHKLPRGLDADVRAGAGTFLLEQAQTFDPAALHILGRHLVLRLDPEHGGAVEREEGRQHDRAAFTLVHHHDGTWSPHGQLTPETAPSSTPPSPPSQRHGPPPTAPRTRAPPPDAAPTGSCSSSASP